MAQGSDLAAAPHPQRDEPRARQGDSAAVRRGLSGRPRAFLAKLDSQGWLESGEAEPAASAAIVGELKLLIPLEGLIDLGAEKARLAKEITRVEGEIGKCNAKLGVPTFVANAPAAVVEEMRQRLATFSVELDGLREQQRRLG
jgi:valyl-tRNA synthetase